MSRNVFFSRSLLRILETVTFRISQIVAHPISKRAPLKGVFRYLFFNTAGLIIQKLEFEWIDGLKFTAKRGEAGIVGNVYFGLNDFEDSGFVLHFLRPADLFVDVGANLGHFTLLASGVRNCKSIAIEPVPSTYGRLKENIELNNLHELVTILNLGVSDERGQLYFSTDKGAMNRIVSKNYEKKVEIFVDNLDKILSSLTPSIIKIDVEGFEYFVLKGSRNILKCSSLKCIVIEANGSAKNYGRFDSDAKSILESFGFSAFQYDPNNRSLVRSVRNDNSFNMLYIRDIDYVKQRCSESEPFDVWGVSV